jgi:hypothetical protein
LKEDLVSGVSSPPLSTVTSLPAPAMPARKPSRTWIPLAAVAVALAGAAAAYVYWSGRGAPSTGGAETGTRRFASIALNRLTTTGTAGLAAISDDGRYVAYVVTEEGKSGLWLRQVATTSNVPIVPPVEARFNGVTFSPDGNHVYYSFYPAGEVYGNLYQVPVLGGGARRVVEDVDGGVSFDPEASGSRSCVELRQRRKRRSSSPMPAEGI